MVTRVNGAPLQGVWFSKDVRFIAVTCTNGGTSFLTELGDSPTAGGVNGKLEQAIEAIETRGTVIGLNVSGANTFDVIVDYAQAFDGAGAGPLGQGTLTDAAVIAEVEALIDGITDLSASGLTVQTGFAAAAAGTPS